MSQTTDRSPLLRARRHLIRAALAGVAFIGGIVMAQIGQVIDDGPDKATASEATIAIIGGFVLVIAGVLMVRSVARAVAVAMQARADDTRGAPVAIVVRMIGYVLVVIALLASLNIPLQGLLLGSALTGVVIGIAAQQTLGNFFAGILLLGLRPFTVGQQVVLRSGPLGGEYEGLVTNMTLFYVELITTHGAVALPNAGVLAAAVGPGARSASLDGPPDDEAPA